MGKIKRLIDLIELHSDSSKFWRKRGAEVGRGCSINTSANLGSEPYLIKIGDNVRINAGVQIITHDGGVWVIRNLIDEYQNCDLFKKVSIGNNVHIGTNAVIMPGVTIGNNCIIGVGAIVTKNIPDNSIAVGVPARVIETLDEYLEKNKAKFLNTKYMNFNDKKNYLMEYFNEKN